MRLTAVLFAVLLPTAVSAQESAPAAEDAAVLRRIYDAALVDSPMYGQLRELVEKHPGRLSGSKNLEGAVLWAKAELEKLGCDRIELQAVQVPHWERGAKESAVVRSASGRTASLAVLALGNSAATPPGGRVAEVVEVKSLDELRQLGRERVAGKIVFFNRPMDRRHISNAPAYVGAVDQRTRGPALASELGAAAALVRSMTFADDDVPHTGNTTFPAGVAPIPAAALGVSSAQTLANLIQTPGATVELKIHARTLADALSHNVIGEIRGAEAPEKVILVGGHLDSWDVAPGAHDDGAGCVQALEVLRVLRAAGHRPRHTIRVVLFTNEENGIRGATEYARVVGEKNEVHLLALESDSGGFAPHGFNLGNAAGDAHLRAERWLPLLKPYGIHFFQAGTGGVDVAPLMRFGYTVAGPTQDAPRYFDYHHTAIDTLDKVQPRELQLGAAAMAALVYLVDRHGP
ncbi:MAG TPA: M20/M25/M40 family metallo-hydrolase [Opitutaceae bacterium]|nr:M20/M25/M40 family metallo-hydrolase [Opitutaceae bacterium]